jgi:hypothetical protein
MMGTKGRTFVPLINVSLEDLVPQDHFYQHLNGRSISPLYATSCSDSMRLVAVHPSTRSSFTSSSWSCFSRAYGQSANACEWRPTVSACAGIWAMIGRRR